MHTAMWSKVIFEIPHGEIPLLIHLCSAEFAHDR
jgi:hypothetical protein